MSNPKLMEAWRMYDDAQAAYADAARAREAAQLAVERAIREIMRNE